MSIGRQRPGTTWKRQELRGFNVDVLKVRRADGHVQSRSHQHSELWGAVQKGLQRRPQGDLPTAAEHPQVQL